MKTKNEVTSPIAAAFLPRDDEQITGLSCGYIVFSNGNSASAPTSPRKLIILLPSVMDLLGGLSTFLTHQKDKQYIFEGMAGDCYLKFYRRRNCIAVYSGHETREANRVANVVRGDLIAAVSSALDSLDQRCARVETRELSNGSNFDEIESETLAEYRAAAACWRNLFEERL